jgi:hypothetical protein
MSLVSIFVLQMMVWWIIGIAWFFLIGCIIAGRGTVLKRHLFTGCVFAVSMLALVQLVRYVNNVPGQGRPYLPADEPTTAPAHPYRGRHTNWIEQA